MLDPLIPALLGAVDSLPQLAGVIATVGVCGYALARGGPDERLTAVVLLALYLAAPFLQNTADWQAPQYRLMASDAVLTAYLVWLALRSDRFWPVWAAGFQSLSMLAWLGHAIEPSVRSLMIVFNLIGYLILASLVLGVNGWRNRLNDAPAAAPVAPRH